MLKAFASLARVLAGWLVGNISMATILPPFRRRRILFAAHEHVNIPNPDLAGAWLLY